tara:strand:+ start:535 stop:1566 length:1032 start_codon:yes stop_codon:yes gene_type:complete
MEEITELLLVNPHPTTGKLRAASTVRNYVYNLNKIAKLVTGENISASNLSYLYDYENILSIITTTFKIGSQKNYLTAITTLLTVLINKYPESSADDWRVLALNQYNIKIGEIKDTLNKTSLLQEKTISQLTNWTTIKNLKSILSGYKKYLTTNNTFKKSYINLSPKEKKTLRYWLIGSLYIADPGNAPVRSNYAPMPIISEFDYKALSEEELKLNYLVISPKNKKMFSFGNYKNVSTYGLKTNPVHKKLNSIINAYLKVLGTFKNADEPQYLLYTQNNTMMTSIGLSTTIPKVFEPTGKNITINSLRHIFISENISGDFLTEKTAISEAMHHSVSTQEKYRLK